jgi:hypothetical protein
MVLLQPVLVYPLPPRPGEEVDTLCGLRATLAEEDFPQLAQYHKCKRMCLDCDATWRVRENLPPRR